MLMSNDLFALTSQLPHSLGALSINTLPDVPDLQRLCHHIARQNHQQGRKYKDCYTAIVNLDVDSLPGSHWVGVYRDNVSGVVEVFDSLGQSTPPLLQSWAARNGRRWTYDKLHRMVQHPLSVTCGYYAFIFTLARPYFKNLHDTVTYIDNCLDI